MKSYLCNLFYLIIPIAVLANNLREVEFGDPDLQTVRLAQKYELRGVTFIKGEKPIGFIFKSFYSGHLRLEMEPLHHSKKLYDFFKEIFREPLAPMSKYWGNLGDNLNVEWRLKTENKEAILQNIEKTMSIEWRKAFDTLFSAHET